MGMVMLMAGGPCTCGIAMMIWSRLQAHRPLGWQGRWGVTFDVYVTLSLVTVCVFSCTDVNIWSSCSNWLLQGAPDSHRQQTLDAIL